MSDIASAIRSAMNAESVALHGDLCISITQERELVITNAESSIELNPEQVLALRSFLHTTLGQWRPA